MYTSYRQSFKKWPVPSSEYDKIWNEFSLSVLDNLSWVLLFWQLCVNYILLFLATKEATILDTGYCVPYELDRIKVNSFFYKQSRLLCALV